MGKMDCKDHGGISKAIKSNGEEASLLREMLSGKISLKAEQKVIINDALLADQNAIIDLVHKRSMHIKDCEECKKGE